jgi:hypothetical protein
MEGKYFFIPIGFRYGDAPDNYSHIASVYGPYSTREQAVEAGKRVLQNHTAHEFLLFQGELVEPM